MSSAVADNSMRLGGVVINRAKGGEIKFHDAKSGQYSRIDRDGYGVVSGTIDHILHRNVVYKFSTDYNFTLPGTVVVVASSGTKEGEDAKQSTLDLGVTGPDGTHNRYTTLPGEPVPATENAPNGAAVAPGISVSHAPLAGVVFTSSLQPSLATLSLDDSDKASEQQETLDGYKRAIDGMLYRHDITVVQTSSAIVIPISLGPLTITIAFDISTLEGYVEASIIGISLGKAKFDLTKGASIGVDVWLAKASVGVTVDSKAIYLEAHASVRFDGSVDFGPEAIYHF